MNVFMRGPKATLRRGPTQDDVARVAGVSQATVSFVLNQRSSISVTAETRDCILEAVRTLGYVPNQIARNLRTSKTHTIAAIIPDIANPFYPAFARGIQDVADKSDYTLSMFNTDGEAGKEQRSLRSVLEGRLAGVILVPLHHHSEDYLPLLLANTAVVCIGDLSGAERDLPLDSIRVVQQDAARDAVLYLIEQGRRSIGMLAGEAGSLAQQTRTQGYKQALRAHGLPIDESLIQLCKFTEPGGFHAMRQLLALSRRPDAVFAVNDLCAMGAMLAIRQAGLAVPTDVAIIGFDDIPIARLLTPPLTTISQDAAGLGQKAAELVLARLNGSAPEGGVHSEWPCRLVIRESA